MKIFFPIFGVLISVCMLFSHSEHAEGFDVFNATVSQKIAHKATEFLNNTGSFTSEQVAKCLKGEVNNYVFSKSAQPPRENEAIFPVGTQAKVSCSNERWDVQILADFKWRDVTVPRNSHLRFEDKYTFILPDRGQITIGKIVVQNEFRINVEDLRFGDLYSDFKESYADGQAKKIEVIDISIRSGVTKVRVLEVARSVCPYPVGSELYYSGFNFIKAVISTEINCMGLKVPKGSAIWRVLNTIVVRNSVEMLVGDLKVPEESYILHRFGDWDFIFLSRSVEYKGKKIKEGELISSDFIEDKKNAGTPQLVGIGVPGESENEISERELKNMSVFHVISIAANEISFSQGTLRVKMNEKTRNLLNSKEITLLGEREGKYAFLSDSQRVCPGVNSALSECQLNRDYTVLSSEKKYWGVAYALNEPPNITHIEKVDFKPSEEGPDTLLGEIRCSPRQDDNESEKEIKLAKVSWNIDLKKKNVRLEYGCDDKLFDSYEQSIGSFEKFRDLTHVKSVSAHFYLKQNKFFRITKDEGSGPYMRLLVNGLAPVYVENVDSDGAHPIISPKETYAYEEDTGC